MTKIVAELRKMCLLERFSVVKYINEITMRDWERWMSGDRVQEMEIDLIRENYKCGDEKGCRFYELTENVKTNIMYSLYKSFE